MILLRTRIVVAMDEMREAILVKGLEGEALDEEMVAILARVMPPVVAECSTPTPRVLWSEYRMTLLNKDGYPCMVQSLRYRWTHRSWLVGLFNGQHVEVVEEYFDRVLPSDWLDRYPEAVYNDTLRILENEWGTLADVPAHIYHPINM